MIQQSRKVLLAAAVMAVFSMAIPGTHAQDASPAATADSFQSGFMTPPDSAKPRVWWHWTNANITKEGITKDLEWMKRVGIGGFMLADVASNGGQEVENKLHFFTPEWFDAVHHAAAEADRLGLEMSIFSSAGWSETGGPWVKSPEAMKKLVWSETDVQGPKSFSDKLGQPPWTNGTFGTLKGQNVATYDPEAAARGAGAAGAVGRGGAAAVPPNTPYYGDSAVIAFRTPDDETDMKDLNPKVTSSGWAAAGGGGAGGFGRGRGGAGRAGAPGAAAPAPAPDAAPLAPVTPNFASLWDDNFQTSLAATPGPDGSAWIQYEFPNPVKAKAVTLICPGRGVPYGAIQVSDDGTNFHNIAELPGPEQYRAGTIKTYAFPETTAKFFRVVQTAPAGAPAEVINQTEPQPGGNLSIGEFIVHTGARGNLWEEKAGFNFIYEYDKVPTPAVPASSAVAQSDVVDLTSKMDKDGTLHWDVPAGKWTILRMGYSLTGSQNRPSTPAGQGPEVDKMNAKYVENYFKGYFGPLQEHLGDLMGKSLKNVMMDSFEGGMQNWTDDMIAQFKKLRGYDPTPFLPVLTGRIVGSSDASDRFLWDFRRTIADLLATEHFGTMDKLAHEKGLTISGESYGVSMEIMEDTLLTKKQIDIPMGEFWLGRMHPLPEYVADVRGASSAAHAYGKKIVATESFTGGGYEAPSTYKNLADYWFTQGVNRIVFHTSAHQPLDTKPGNIMVGTHVNRNITWAEQAGGVMSYFARTCYMLQQGLSVADCAYLLNEGVPSSQSFWGAGLTPACPAGYDYDCVNADILLNRMSVAPDGRIVLPDGMSYRMLVLPQVTRMRPELLRKIKELALGGATILGPRPTMSPSLQGGDANADAEVQQLAAEIWGDLDGISRNRHYYGKGRVIWGLTPEQALSESNVAKDAEFAGPLDSAIVWTHRRDGDAEIYFVANRNAQSEDVQARFRVAGKEAEIWHPDTGTVEPASYSTADGKTTVPIHFDSHESVFVVFRKTTSAPTRTIAPAATAALATIDGPWDVTFPPKFGAPDHAQLPQLASWTDNADAGIKYFSGTATYTKSIDAPQDWFKPNAKITIDLGAVKDLASVSVNGKDLGNLWKPPYTIDVTGALKPGQNTLEIKVTNEWSNRIAGDRVAPADKKILAGPAAPAFGGGAGAAAGAATRPGGVPARGGAARGGGGGGGGFGQAAGPMESGLLGPVTIQSVTTH